MHATNITDMDTDVPPSAHPGVDAIITQLEKDLRRLLGADTTYVLVIALDKPDALHVQAVTDTSPRRAMDLLRFAMSNSFESLQ